MAFFRIPGNIKQQYVPFVLNPYADINMYAESSPDLASAKPQLFTFRDDREDPGAGKGVLNICPQAFKDYMKDDISWKLMFPYKEGKLTTDALGYKDVLNCIPGIQIREFLPDTRLDQCINFFSDMIDTMKSAFKENKDAAKDSQNKQQEAKKEGDQSGFFTKLTKACNWALGYLTGSLESENLMKDIQSIVNKAKAAENYGFGDESLNNYILNFPYILYYKFQSCVTTNIYELPCFVESKALYSSTGHEGWGGDNTIEIVNQMLKSIPGLGSIINSILGNIRISYLPFWDSKSGQGTAEPDFTIKIDLFNDTAEAAIVNFIFVNTIVPNNKWIQYNVFQHSSSLYDIKIEGYNRLFACSGNFNVTYKGVLRDPPKALLEKLIQNHYSIPVSLDPETVIRDKIIKIPDVYTIEMTFKSLLPANFNNFIYQYSKSINPIEEYKGHAYDKSTAVEMLGTGIGAFTGKLADHWKSEKFPEE